jgi:hypothetical protein
MSDDPAKGTNDEATNDEATDGDSNKVNANSESLKLVIFRRLEPRHWIE